MRTNNETFTCGICNHHGDRRDAVVIHPLSPLRCKDAGACGRRQKRDKALAEIAEMATKPRMHPIDKFSRTAVAVCAFFMGSVIAMGLTYIWFGV